MKWNAPSGTIHRTSYARAREIHKAWLNDEDLKSLAKKHQLPEEFVRFIVNRMEHTENANPGKKGI